MDTKGTYTTIKVSVEVLPYQCSSIIVLEPADATAERLCKLLKDIVATDMKTNTPVIVKEFI